MDCVSIATLKASVTEQAQPFAVHAQLDSLTTKTARSGSPYLEFGLVDATGAFSLRAWNDTPLFQALSSLRPGQFVRIEAEWQSNGPYGLEPKRATLRELNETEKSALLEGSAELRERQTRDFESISSFCGSIRDPRLQLLCQHFLQEHGERLRRTAAARNFHHARRGGLVEHVAQMMRSAHALCSVYSSLNRDLLLAGVLFHDCGKLWESCYAEHEFTMPHTEAGELLGHIAMGLELINRLWRDLLGAPEAVTWQNLSPPSDHVRLHLLHLVGAHHGEFAFGSPVLPRTPEAVALHYIDNLDAKMDMFTQGYLTGSRLAPTIVERVRPLPANLVEPLAAFDPLEVPPVE
jgi:3'-5' exoribonuclease